MDRLNGLYVQYMVTDKRENNETKQKLLPFVQNGKFLTRFERGSVWQPLEYNKKGTV